MARRIYGKEFVRLAALVLLIGFWPTTGAAKPGAVQAGLWDRVQAGPVQVIVQLSTTVTSGAYPVELAQIQDRTLSGLPADELVLVRSLSSPSPGVEPFMVLRVTPAALAALEGSDNVVGVFLDPLFKASDLSMPAAGGIAPAGLDTSVALIQAPQVWDAGYLGEGKVIAIVDTGVDGTHPFLAGKVVAEACYTSRPNCPNGTTQQVGPGAAVPCDLPFDRDHRVCAHGTHVAGIAAGNDGAYYGVAPEAKIVAVQVFSEFSGADCAPDPSPCARTALSNLVDAIGYVGRSPVQRDVAAINVSVQRAESHISRTACGSQLGGHMILESQISISRLVGRPTIAPAGDRGLSGRIAVPACLPSAFSVAASYSIDDERRDTLHEQSNRATRGPDGRDLLDFVAPGVEITSAVPITSDPDGYASRTGTEFAVPHVAGALALLRQAVPGATVDQIMNALKSTGVEVPSVTARRIQICEALLALGGDCLLEAR